jgi:hypothetical protein
MPDLIDPSRVIARTGATEWRQSEPKTIELYNTDRDAQGQLDAREQRMLQQQMMEHQFRQELGMNASQKELADLDLLNLSNPYKEDADYFDKARTEDRKKENQQHVEDEARFYNAPPKPATSKDRRHWRKSIREFDQYMRKDGERAEDGFDFLLRSGAVWADPDDKGGWLSSVMLTDRQLKSIGEGFKKWERQVFGGDPYYMKSWQESQDQWRNQYQDFWRQD